MSPTFDSLNNLTQENVEQILNILESGDDVSSCLANCSNQGQCMFIDETYACECEEYFIGESCQTDIRPCYQSERCLHNGTCVDAFNFTSFECQCPENGLYYGLYCEFVRDLCENVTCFMHGNCIQIQNETQCKCFNGFEGEMCEIESSSLKAVKSVKSATTVICLVFILTFVLLVIGNDLLRFLKIGNEKIDMNEWRYEKFHGTKAKSRKNKKAKLNSV